MFPHYDQQWTLVADRHDHLEAVARRRRFLGRARADAPATKVVTSVVAAVAPAAIGRTPIAVEGHKAA